MRDFVILTDSSCDLPADMAAELTRGIEAQRGLQSCSQALKMYDTVLDKATDIGRA